MRPRNAKMDHFVKVVASSPAFELENASIAIHNAMLKHLNDSTLSMLHQNTPISGEDSYNQMIVVLNKLLDEIGDNEEHVLIDLLHQVGDVISDYETKHFPITELKRD